MQLMELVPDYYDEFHCQCGACSFSCCQEWSISLYEKDYRNLMSLELSQEDRKKLEETFVRDYQEGPNHTYAAIRLGTDKRCGFQDSNGLCHLQAIAGEENLPEVCRTFPRTAALVYGTTLDKNLRLSCPAVVELLMQREAGVQFLSRTTEEAVSTRIVGRLKGHKKQIVNSLETPGSIPTYQFDASMEPKNPLLRFFWEFKTLMIGVLQNRDCTIHQRILYIGVLLQTFLKLEAEGHIEEARALALAEMERTDYGNILDTLNRLPQKDPLSLYWLCSLSSLRNPGSMMGSPSLCKELCNVRMRLKMEWQGEKFMISRSALARGKQHFEEYCEANPHVAENLLISLFQTNAMPFGGMFKGSSAKTEKIDLWRNYRWFCVEFAVWQLFMRSRFVDEIPDDREIARLTSVVFRLLPNQKEFVEQLESKLTVGVDANPMEIISILIK